jgi:ferredoxin/flavodoxin---NADP+ reductase
MNPHIVAIFGGAISGAEAAQQLSQRGIRSVVFEQNALPYGKIEDGLPKWHAKLRDKEEANINEKLLYPLVTFVPNVRLGEEVQFEDVVKNWGFSAVFLATGAWRDRPLAIDGIQDYVGKGLYYQNAFIHWYNHFHEPNYSGLKMETPDGAIVVGGGLASIDVVKALMMETVQKALKAKGIEVNMFDLERGIAKVLGQHGLTLEDLGLKGCTLVYRRRVKDMPLFPGDTGTPEQLAKAQLVREKVLANAQSKFLFNVLPCYMPVDKIVENGRLAGLVLRETRIENDRVVELPGTEKELRSPLTVSSIGSIPEPVPGIPMIGPVFELGDVEHCRLKGYDHVFALGNAVTGRGNIKESMEHGRTVTESIAQNYLSDPESSFGEHLRKKETSVSEQIRSVLDEIEKLPAPSFDEADALFGKVTQLQRKAGYKGNYSEWIAQHLPPRLEQVLGLAGH